MPDIRPLDARFLYVLKDGSGVYYVTGEPTLGDIERVKAGSLEIIRLSDFRHLGTDETWQAPKIGALSAIYGIPGQPVNLPLDAVKRSKKLP
jgi:hypothetical protein